MSVDFDIEQFKRDVSRHELHRIREDGVYRHLRFRRPDSTSMYFDLITWPGHLCYTGDMGTFVFERLTDMLEFFRRGANRRPYQIDFRYWAEKVQAADKHDGVTEWCPEDFRTAVREYFDDFFDGEDVAGVYTADELWNEIEGQVLCHAEDESRALIALHDFQWDGFEFVDWERDCRTWSFRFLWCCHALEWAIDVYDRDESRAEASVRQILAQRDHEVTFLRDQLTAIHALLYPPAVELPDGRAAHFHSPNADQWMQLLSDEIRQIPERMAAALLQRKDSTRATDPVPV